MVFFILFCFTPHLFSGVFLCVKLKFVMGILDRIDAAFVRQIEEVDEVVADFRDQGLLLFSGQLFLILVLLEEFQVLFIAPDLKW